MSISKCSLKLLQQLNFKEYLEVVMKKSLFTLLICTTFVTGAYADTLTVSRDPTMVDSLVFVWVTTEKTAPVTFTVAMKADKNVCKPYYPTQMDKLGLKTLKLYAETYGDYNDFFNLNLAPCTVVNEKINWSLYTLVNDTGGKHDFTLKTNDNYSLSLPTDPIGKAKLQ